MRCVLLVVLLGLFAYSAFAAVAQGSGSGSLSAGSGIFRKVPFTFITASNATGTLVINTDGTFSVSSTKTVNFVVSASGTWTVEDAGGVQKANLGLLGDSSIKVWSWTTLSGNFASVGSFSKTLTGGTSYYFAFGTANAAWPPKNSVVNNFSVTMYTTI